MTDDTISRQAAITALEICDLNEDGINCHKCPLRDERWNGAWEDDETACCKKLLRDSAKLLSAQPEPEPLTDKEQRIFLVAMGREEKICKKVDDECGDCKEPHEVSLIRVCHEITRKVKGALWS